MEKTEKLIMQEDAWKPLKEMNLTDDFLFDVATTELENCKTIIELSTGLRLKSLKWKEGQKVVHNIPGKRGIRMDFVAESEDGRVFDVEMQNRKEGNIPKRTRFYQALMDAPLLKSGEKGFDKLKPLFIIVLCDYDPYGKKKYCYTFENRCKEQPDLLLGDEVTKLFLSTKGENADEVPKELVDFLHYITESNEKGLPEECDERLRRLHESIQEIKKSTSVEVEYMKMEERERLVNAIKEMTLHVNGLRDYNEAIITKGGISVNEINPKTMESKKEPGIYFVGEVLDLDAMTGGYNLQIAWSTGYLAGNSICDW